MATEHQQRVDMGTFSKSNPNLQLAWDSTSLGTLKECPYKYALSMLEGWQPKSTSFHLAFGILFHSCLELYDRQIAEGKSHPEAMLLAVRKSLEDSGTRDADGTFTPWQSDIVQKTRFTLVRTIVWYLDEFGDKDFAKTVLLANGKPAVELSFRFSPDIQLDQEEVILCGHLDRVVSFNNAEWVMDRKTTKNTIDARFFSKFTPENQMSLYTAAGKIIFERPVQGVIIDGAQLAVNFSRFRRGFANRTPAQLDEWLDDTKLWLRMAAIYAAEGSWPMNDKSCGNYGGCKYLDICNKDPSVRYAFLESNFVRMLWNPLEVRGD